MKNDQDLNHWWFKPSRTINIIVDNESWVLPYTQDLLRIINDEHQDRAQFFRNHNEIPEADISFYLGCVKITPPAIYQKSKKNLVVHASNLPQGRGFSPWTWQVLEGKNQISICMFEMVEIVDAGPVVFRDKLLFQGHELIDELRDIIGKKIVELCLRYLKAPSLPIGEEQDKNFTTYRKRTPQDSIVDLNMTLEDIFNLLRVVDNEKYPAYFEKNGYKYVLKIFKDK